MNRPEKEVQTTIDVEGQFITIEASASKISVPIYEIIKVLKRAKVLR